MEQPGIKKIARVRFSQGTEEAPKPLARSNSTTGLSSLSKGLIEHEKNIGEMNEMIQSMRDVITRYEEEVKQLQKNGDQQELIIKTQSDELIKTKSEIDRCLTKIQEIWES